MTDNLTDEAWASNGTDPAIARIQYIAYQIALPTISGTGIISNLLNLVTLRNKSLQSVAYKHIRAVAYFDLIGLVLVVGACIRIAGKTPPWYYLVIYQAYFELPLLNGFLAASLFTAVALSTERYFQICRPLDTRSCQPQIQYRINVLTSFAVALLVHLPMSLEFQVKRELSTGHYKRVPNEELHNRHAKIFSVYEVCREVIRCLAVLAMLLLNYAIIRALRAAGQRRKRMRGSNEPRLSGPLETAPLTSGRNAANTPRLPTGGKSYEENRITTMMIGMSIVYVIGNLPQACLMPFNEDEYASSYTYQMFRAVANLAEINNHCLNFYIFCFTSKDFYTAFFELWRKPQILVNHMAAKVPSVPTFNNLAVIKRGSAEVLSNSYVNPANQDGQEIFV